MNLKEMFMSALRNDKPMKWMGYAFAAFPQDKFHVVMDPISVWDILYLEGEAVKDHWGVTHRFRPGVDPGIIPIVTEENKVIKDITKWRDYVHFPEIPTLDWSDAKKAIAGIDRETTLVMVPSFRGLFERAHCLMPFEELLVNLYEEPEALEEFFAAYTDWKLKVFEQLVDNLQPDMIHSHDDWGSKTQLFMQPAKFRELLKPHYERLYGYLHKRNVLVQHHTDTYCMGIEKDMVDMHIDMWQGVMATNDIQLAKKNTGGKLLMLGGIEQTLIDQSKDAISEDAIRAEVRRVIDLNAPGGSFLPCIPSLECINTWVTPIVIDECNRYGAEWLKKQSC